MFVPSFISMLCLHYSPTPLQVTPAVPRDNFAPPVRLKFYRGKYSPNPFGRYAPDIFPITSSFFCKNQKVADVRSEFFL